MCVSIDLFKQCLYFDCIDEFALKKTLKAINISIANSLVIMGFVLFQGFMIKLDKINKFTET